MEYNVVVVDRITDSDIDIMETDNLIRIDEVYLPKILVNLGLYKSVSQVKRDRPGCDKEINYGFTIFDTKQYRIAKKYGFKDIYTSIGKFNRVYIWRPKR